MRCLGFANSYVTNVVSFGPKQKQRAAWCGPGSHSSVQQGLEGYWGYDKSECHQGSSRLLVYYGIQDEGLTASRLVQNHALSSSMGLKLA